MAVAAVLGATAMGSTAPSAAEPAIRVDVERPSELPFSSAELLAAVDARVRIAQGAPDGSVVVVRVGPAETPGRVAVVATSGTVDVLTDGKAPAEAARLVALAVVDVTRAEPPMPAATLVVPASAAPVEPVGRTARAGLAVAFYPGASVGLGGGVSFEPTLDLSARVGGGVRWSWRVGLSAGFASASAPWIDRSFTLSTVPVRSGLRWRWRRLEIGGGAVARVYRTAGLDGGGGVMWGGFASVAASGPLAARWRWTVMAAGDAYSDRTVFLAGGQPLLTSGPFVVWLGVGALFGGGAS
jgi:hypothetical protein